MRKLLIFSILLVLLTACTQGSKPSSERIQEFCAHIPNLEHLEASKPFLTEDFYDALETMISLPDSTEVLHEWEFWFVTADGSPMAEGATQILSVTPQDATHVRVTLSVQPPDEDYEPELHTLLLERTDNQWLLDDFDSCKSSAHARISHHIIHLH